MSVFKSTKLVSLFINESISSFLFLTKLSLSPVELSVVLIFISYLFLNHLTLIIIHTSIKLSCLYLKNHLRHQTKQMFVSVIATAAPFTLLLLARILLLLLLPPLDNLTRLRVRTLVALVLPFLRVGDGVGGGVTA